MRKFVKIKAIALVAFFLLALVAVTPSFARVAGVYEQLPTWMTETFDREFKLGLDLQGGLHLEYSVDVDGAIKNKLDQVANELEAAFKEKKDLEVAVTREGIDELHVNFPKVEDVALATDDVLLVTSGVLERIAEDQATSTGVMKFKMPEVAIAENRKAIVDEAINTVRRRVDSMGVAEPNIYPKNRQVVVELPGLSDTATEVKAATMEAGERLRTLLQQGGAAQVMIAALREDPGAIMMTIPEQDVKALLAGTFGDGFADGKTLVDERLGVDFEVITEVEADPARVTLALTPSSRDSVLEGSSDFRRLLRAIERAAVLEMHLVDDESEFRDTGKPYLRALYDAGFVHEGMGFAVNIEQNYGRPEKGGSMVKQPYLFLAQDRGTLERFFASLPAEWRLPATHKMAYGPVPVQTRRGAEPEILWRSYVLKSRADITGDRIVQANVTYKDDTGLPQVSVKFDRVGASAFEQMSGDNVGRKMAIVMDRNVVSDPIFNERIAGGNVVITLGALPGESVREQANDLAKVLKSGSLPARLNKEFEIRVGADLGADSVNRGFRAFLVGFLLVILFTAVYYRKAGLIAVFALLMNMVMVMAAMALFRATLTLPGIAGIVLTIGMAVDANVIIFERVREYLRDDYNARAAIDAGYDRAFTTIFDSQITTAIAGLVLAQFGSGPIRGFAITLLIGIATSIFTGVFATRVFFDWQSNRKGFDKVSI